MQNISTDPLAAGRSQLFFITIPTHFRTSDMARFTWKRLGRGGILIRSLKTTLHYYQPSEGKGESEGWQRAGKGPKS